MDKVLFVGLGAMGSPMATNIVKAGIKLDVYDLVPANCDAAVKMGARRVTNLADAYRDVDVLITMLPSTKSVEDVVNGPDGALKNMKSGGIIMDMSTIAPSGTDRVSISCKEAGVRFIDAPVGRQVPHAIRGESLFMVGCNQEADFQKVKPYLDAMGTDFIRCGAVGMGTRMKIVNNLQIIAIAQLTAEAIGLSQKLGLDINLVKEVNFGTTANNGQMQFTFANKVLRGDVTPGFTLELAHKDLELAMEAAKEIGISLPTCGAATEEVKNSLKNFGSLDFSALLKYTCKLADVKVPHLSD